MAVATVKKRIVCPFCLRVFAIPLSPIKQKDSKFEYQLNTIGSSILYERQSSRLQVIDQNIFWEGQNTDYHLHRCEAQTFHSDAAKDEQCSSELTSKLLIVPSKHSALVATPLVVHVLDSTCEPSKYLRWCSHRSW